MKALHFDGKEIAIIDKPIPERKEDEVLIRTEYAGICNTDIEILKGYMKFTGTLGHEFVGIVQESPLLEFFHKKVVGEINLGCGVCSLCLQGQGKHCPNRTVLGIEGKDGVFAEYFTLPYKNLHVISSDISELKAVFVEPLAAACEIFDQVEILPEYQVLVLGDGKLAQLIARVMSLYTEKLIVVGKHEAKLKHLKDLGIATILLTDFEKQKDLFHLVIEATGSWGGWDLAVKRVLPRGFIILKSTYAGNFHFNPAPLVINEIKVVGSRCGPFPSAIRLLKKNAIDPTDLISKIFPISKWEEAFRMAKNPKSLKVLLSFKE